MTIRKFSFEIEGLFKATGEVDINDSLIPSPILDVPVDPIENPDEEEPNPTEPPTGDLIELDWDSLVKSGGGKLEKGNYHVSKWQTHTNNYEILGDKDVNIFFGANDYSEWTSKEKHPRFLFDTSEGSNMRIKGVNLFLASEVQEVQPFYMTIFRGTGLNQNLVLEDVETNMESGLLYSASQEVTQFFIRKRVKFKGIIWEELKANNGGGLESIMEDCELVQVDPPTYFESKLTLLDHHTFKSEVPLSRMENMFIENGNSCNIIFVDGKTFYLPKSDELGYTKTIRPISQLGDIVTFQCYEDAGIRYIRTKDVELQAGDMITVDGVDCELKVKDRSHGNYFHSDPWGNGNGYWIDFYPELQNLPLGDIKATVKSSSGLDIIGKELKGFLIFKYNKHWQTNVYVDHGLDYMLLSNPFGVLSYNHEEITINYKNVIHRKETKDGSFKPGFYRQSRSGVGHSNGYRMVNCKGYEDQFSAPVEIMTT